MSRTWTEEEIKSLVQTNEVVTCRALLQLYYRQTSSERNAKSTTNKNGEGFNSYDAQFLTSVSEFLLAHGHLTAKQLYAVRRRLVKYNRQLTGIANAC